MFSLVATPGQLSIVSISSNTFTITWSYKSSQISFFTVSDYFYTHEITFKHERLPNT